MRAEEKRDSSACANQQEETTQITSDLSEARQSLLVETSPGRNHTTGCLYHGSGPQKRDEHSLPHQVLAKQALAAGLHRRRHPVLQRDDKVSYKTCKLVAAALRRAWCSAFARPSRPNQSAVRTCRPEEKPPCLFVG